jgi:hypothetical protein
MGEKTWFGPRRLGWGLSPVSVEGWVTTIAALGVSSVLARRSSLPPLLRNLPMIVLLAVVVVKGTAPGGPRARSAFDQTR